MNFLSDSLIVTVKLLTSLKFGFLSRKLFNKVKYLNYLTNKINYGTIMRGDSRKNNITPVAKLIAVKKN